MAKKVLIFGATGMLGNAVYNVLKDKYKLVLTVRDARKISLLENIYGGTEKHQVLEFDASFVYQDFLDKKGYPGDYLLSFLKKVGDVDCAINAIGITIPYCLENPAVTFFINSALPHILARIFGSKLIHITTDCVFNGKDGAPYDENSPKTPQDLYGFSKSLGEPENCLTLRTSIIGRELEGFTGLLEWFLQQKARTITGFANHFWNGITTKEFGEICHRIIKNREEFPENGLFHIFSTTVSKYEMLEKFKEKYKIKITIEPVEPSPVDRRLTTLHDFCKKLNIPSFDQMLTEL